MTAKLKEFYVAVLHLVLVMARRNRFKGTETIQQQK